jgi:hypothetical protein
MSCMVRRLRPAILLSWALAAASISPASAQSISSDPAIASEPVDVSAVSSASAPVAPPESSSGDDFATRFNAPEDPAAAPAALAPIDEPVSEEGVPLSSSDAAGKVIKWVLTSHDNGDLPFIVVDKVAAEMFAFNPAGQLLAHAPVLVGITKGDDSEPGVGDRELSDIPVWMRTTPAGRFVANFGPAAGHKEPMLWVDLVDAISLHPVVTSNPKEHRLARIKSPTAADNRITFGCINVDKTLYNTVVEPLFHDAGGVVYVLPEVRPLELVFAGVPPAEPDLLRPFDQVFASYKVDLPQAPVQAASQ